MWVISSWSGDCEREGADNCDSHKQSPQVSSAVGSASFSSPSPWLSSPSLLVVSQSREVWVRPAVSGTSLCPEQRSSSISASCSRVDAASGVGGEEEAEPSGGDLHFKADLCSNVHQPKHQSLIFREGETSRRSSEHSCSSFTPKGASSGFLELPGRTTYPIRHLDVLGSPRKS